MLLGKQSQEQLPKPNYIQGVEDIKDVLGGSVPSRTIARAEQFPGLSLVSFLLETNKEECPWGDYILIAITFECH